MATAEEYLAGAERAKQAGDAEAEAYFRKKAAEAGPAAPKYDRAQIAAAAEKARAAGDTEAEAYFTDLLSQYPAEKSAAPVEAPLLPTPPGGWTRAAPTGNGQANADRFGDTAGELTAGPASATAAFGSALLHGGKDSPSMRGIAADPYLSQLPGPVQSTLGFAGDLGGMVLSGLGTALAGGIGLGTEFVPGQDKQAESKLGGDLLDMSMFAAPEMSGVSSAALSAGRASRAALPEVPVADARAIPVPPPVPAEAMTPAKIGALAKKAAMGSKPATKKLAEAAQVDPEAAAAAQRLGIDLPADVFSDNPAVKAAAGLTRSKVASEPEALWHRIVTATRDRADELMASISGSPDIASTAEKVKSALTTTRDDLKTQSGALYDEVDAAISPSARVGVDHTVAALNNTIDALGGVDGMTQAERNLYKMVTGDQPVTYGRILREKSLIGRAIGKLDSPYSSIDTATLKRLYGALADDQTAAVAATGDGTLAAKLKAANDLTAKRKDLEGQMVSAFGKDLAGSLVPKLNTAVSGATKGDIGTFIRIMKVVPPELRKEVAATALSAATRSKRASSPGFGLAEFAKVYGGIRANAPVKAALGVQIGPEGMQMLDDLHSVAERVQSADSYVLRTGKANQAVEDAMMADGVVGKVLQSSVGKRAAKGAAVVGGTMVGGAPGAVAADALTAALMNARPDVLLKAGRMFASDEFKAAALAAAEKGTAPAETTRAVARSPAFMAWAKAAGIDDPAGWLGAAFPAVAAAGETANANQDPYDRLWQRYGR